MSLLFKTASTLLGAATLSALLASAAAAGPVVCAHQAEDRMTFTVSFNAQWENSVILRNTDTGQRLRTFNNFYSNGAGGEWNQGAGSFTYTVEDQPCVEIIVQHKQGTANPALAWNASRVRTDGPGRFGFEDGGDSDFNDVRVRVRVRGLDGSNTPPAEG